MNPLAHLKLSAERVGVAVSMGAASILAFAIAGEDKGAFFRADEHKDFFWHFLLPIASLSSRTAERGPGRQGQRFF